eukprot:Amastigsp_a348265_4.p3 type:complete len:103 gc:universal Amastigsp_a348265_4:279-587(+)
MKTGGSVTDRSTTAAPASPLNASLVRRRAMPRFAQLEPISPADLPARVTIFVPGGGGATCAARSVAIVINDGESALAARTSGVRRLRTTPLDAVRAMSSCPT